MTDLINDKSISEAPDVYSDTINWLIDHGINEKDAVTDYRVNALSAAMAVQASVTRLTKNKSASSVVLFSSVAVQKGFPMHASISMAKGAVEGLTRSLAAELAPKIRVNAIAPSVTRTPLSDKLLTNEDLAASIEKQHPLKRLGDAQDIASMAAFLISEQAAWITGQVISVDGGRSSLESR